MADVEIITVAEALAYMFLFALTFIEEGTPKASTAIVQIVAIAFARVQAARLVTRANTFFHGLYGPVTCSSNHN